MPYKISGTLYDAARIIVIKESDWSIESNTEESSGAYEVDGLESGYKWVLARKLNGEVRGYGYVSPIEYVSPTGNIGLFAGGENNPTSNIIDQIIISSPSNATDFGALTVARRSLSACSNGTSGRGVFSGGYTSYPIRTDTMDYVSISAAGNATDFGNLSETKAYLGACSNRTNDRGVIGGGIGAAYSNVLEYITISSTSNSTDFGDLNNDGYAQAGISNSENNRGIFAGGYHGGYSNVIDYITISSTSNASNFADLYTARSYFTGCSNGTNDRGLFAGGSTGTPTNMIDYITISSLVNAALFGELVKLTYMLAACSNDIGNHGIFAGGNGPTNVIEYVTMSSLSNATAFGDLTLSRYYLSGCSDG